MTGRWVLLTLCLLGCELEQADSLQTRAQASRCDKPNAEGKKCDDGLYCTVDDVCHAGECVGEARPCGQAVGMCSVGVCDEAADRCQAEPREEACVDRCAGAQLTGFYRRGWKRGFEAVARTWDKKRWGDCDLADDFGDRILAKLQQVQGQVGPEDGGETKPKQRCRKAGVLDGAVAALDMIQSSCLDTCFLDGELTGEVAALGYCDATAAAGGPLDAPEWLRGPLNICGLGYEAGCDSSFIGESLAACVDLTEEIYEVSWEATRERVCDYQQHD